MSYLTERTTRVRVGGKYSDSITLEVGLPQGSQLGPRLYSDYTQPIGRLIRALLLLFHLYADDTQLMKPVYCPKDLPQCLTELSTGIQQIAGWM